jgi:hypothetical protein
MTLQSANSVDLIYYVNPNPALHFVNEIDRRVGLHFIGEDEELGRKLGPGMMLESVWAGWTRGVVYLYCSSNLSILGFCLAFR